MIVAHIESFKENLPELKPILPLHWAELALNKDKVPLDPNYDLYCALEDAGQVIFSVLRDNGKMIGYFIGFINPHLHYQTCLTCTMDIFYVHPDHRGSNAGVKLFTFVENHLKMRGVDRWFVGSKNHKSTEWLFKKLGFEPVEAYYSKWLGE